MFRCARNSKPPLIASEMTAIAAPMMVRPALASTSGRSASRSRIVRRQSDMPRRSPRLRPAPLAIRATIAEDDPRFVTTRRAFTSFFSIDAGGGFRSSRMPGRTLGAWWLGRIEREGTRSVHPIRGDESRSAAIARSAGQSRRRTRAEFERELIRARSARRNAACALAVRVGWPIGRLQ
jgi:hypothetical protein